MTFGRAGAVATGLLFVGACSGGSEASCGETAGGRLDLACVSFAPDLGVDLERMERLPDGVFVAILEEGSGEEVTVGSLVTVHYTGWLSDGTRFDSSLDRGEPFRYAAGAGQVIPGWDQGVLGMRAGEIRRLVIPPEMGYGSRGAGGVIPPDAPLVFEVEVLDVQR